MTRDERRATLECLYRARAAIVRGERAVFDAREPEQRQALKALLRRPWIVDPIGRYDAAIARVRGERDAVDRAAVGELQEDELAEQAEYVDDGEGEA